MNTIEYLDAVKARFNWTSDYKLAKELNISRGRVSNYRTGKQGMDEMLCIQVANLLNLNPASVLIDITAERTKFPKAAKILRQTAKQLTSAAASLFLSLSIIYGTFLPTDAIAASYEAFSNNVYYVK